MTVVDLQGVKEAAAKAKAKAKALGLLQPLEALSLDADTLRAATAAAVTYCDVQGAASFADLVERASMLIAPTHRRCRLIAWIYCALWLWAVDPRCPAHGPGYSRKLYIWPGGGIGLGV